ncbi:Neuropeptide-like peptide 36 family protein [Teladorsagia circumcincta]|uniref:Neuropeptide-like peptide 36 family protein n=1 Tax=Teladorsagia circumcincta TaxID=45464 RepID=A0A2G9UVM5_TELCI|nr:Neuropeptide-like peptide 36 family protein [Teladorsagia circumcincta]
MIGEAMDATVDLKQHLDVIDYFGALVVWVIFFSILFIVSVTCINWCCIQKYDDVTVLEEWGYNHNIRMRMGPHRPSVVGRKIGLAHSKVLKTDGV